MMWGCESSAKMDTSSTRASWSYGFRSLLVMRFAAQLHRSFFSMHAYTVEKAPEPSSLPVVGEGGWLVGGGPSDDAAPTHPCR